MEKSVGVFPSYYIIKFLMRETEEDSKIFGNIHFEHNEQDYRLWKQVLKNKTENKDFVFSNGMKIHFFKDPGNPELIYRMDYDFFSVIENSKSLKSIVSSLIKYLDREILRKEYEEMSLEELQEIAKEKCYSLKPGLAKKKIISYLLPM